MLHDTSRAEQHLRNIMAQALYVQTAAVPRPCAARHTQGSRSQCPAHSPRAQQSDICKVMWQPLTQPGSSLLFSALFEALYGTLPPDPLSATLPTTGACALGRQLSWMLCSSSLLRCARICYIGLASTALMPYHWHGKQSCQFAWEALPSTAQRSISIIGLPFEVMLPITVPGGPIRPAFKRCCTTSRGPIALTCTCKSTHENQQGPNSGKRHRQVHT